MQLELTDAAHVEDWNRRYPIGTPVIYAATQNAVKTETTGRALLDHAGRAVVPLKNGQSAPHFPFTDIELDTSRPIPKILRYAAKFEQPRGHLNRLGVKVPGWIAVEVRATSQTGRDWRAYYAENNHVITYNSGHEMRAPTPEHLCAAVAELFEWQREPWQCFADMYRKAGV